VSELETFRRSGHDVRVFTLATDRLVADDVCIVPDPWTMARDAFYRSADLVVLHYGIHYDLFNALLLDHGRAAHVVRFHNVTPPALLEGESMWAAMEALDQLAIVDRADAVWCDSSHNAEVLLEHCDIDPRKVVRLPLHVPMIDHEPPPRTPHPDIALLSVGRFVPAKGLHDLIEAYGSLDPTTREGTHLRLIGDLTYSDAGYVERLHAEVDRLGLGDAVHFEHGVSDEALHAAFASTDLYVSASYHEGFCVPVVEALANDCQVIVTDAGSLPDTVGGCGEIVEVGDVNAIRTAIAASVAAQRSGAWEVDRASRHEARVAHLQQFSSTEFAIGLEREALRAVSLVSGYAVDVPVHDVARFAARHRRLLDTLACPRCGAPLEIRSAIEVQGTISCGELVCAAHGRQGVIDAWKVSFLDRDIERWDRRAHDQVVELLDLVHDVKAQGSWRLEREGMFNPGVSGDSLELSFTGTGLEARFVGHEWGGRARITIDGEPVAEVNLRRAERGEIIESISPLPAAEHRVVIEPVGGGEPDGRHQVIVSRLSAFVAPEDARVPDLAACNRGNPFPDRFGRLLGEQPADALVLDCGGGDRRFGDDRVVNLEYLDYELPDLYGDGLHLPFRDDSFDLILSQAVLEHVPDPQRAVDEIIRVLKPGGVLYVEVAFMQPLHAVPHHYMNVTPFGLDHLCRDLDIRDSGTFGGLSVTFEWLANLVGASSKIGTDRVDMVLDALRELDGDLSADELHQVASAAYVEATKRPR
jgi:glycosyltransferase involved in cell wall biosynthesis/SAM-dependent methyltransferase